MPAAFAHRGGGGALDPASIRPPWMRTARPRGRRSGIAEDRAIRGAIPDRPRLLAARRGRGVRCDRNRTGDGGQHLWRAPGGGPTGGSLFPCISQPAMRMQAFAACVRTIPQPPCAASGGARVITDGSSRRGRLGQRVLMLGAGRRAPRTDAGICGAPGFWRAMRRSRSPRPRRSWSGTGRRRTGWITRCCCWPRSKTRPRVTSS